MQPTTSRVFLVRALGSALADTMRVLDVAIAGMDRAGIAPVYVLPKKADCRARKNERQENQTR